VLLVLRWVRIVAGSDRVLAADLAVAVCDPFAATGVAKDLCCTFVRLTLGVETRARTL
jgi:hypothetical protein